MSLENSLALGALIATIAFFCEYVDSTLGMGYGTILTPVLLLMGFAPLQVVPAVLFSELLTGLLAAAAHHSAGNVDFRPRSSDGRPLMQRLRELGYAETFRRVLPVHLRIALLIGLCSAAGTLVAVVLAVRFNPFVVKAYIGVMISLVGLYILVARRRDRPFSWRRLTACGLVASFNKGISGGGYGPVVTGGQIVSGVNGRNAVAITSLAEGLTCMVGFTAYLLTAAVGGWTLLPYICTGALLSVPLSVYTVKRIDAAKLRTTIGVVTLTLGAVTLVRLAF